MSLVSIIAKLSNGNGAAAPAPAYTAIGEFIADSFSSFSGYTVNSSNLQTVTISDNQLHVTSTSTARNAALLLAKTSYGKSTLRNYETTITFKLNSLGNTHGGVLVGVQSTRNTGQNCSTFAVLDTVANKLELVGANNSLAIAVTNASSAITSVPVNTNDTYALTCSVVEDVATATLVNRTTGQSMSVSYTYNFSVLWAGDQVKPNIFYYGFGAMGSISISVDAFAVSSTELSNPDILFLGDSITTGYYGGTATNTYAYKLRSATSKKLQVMAGGYNKAQDVADNLPEILARTPERCFLMIGTNDQASAGAFTTLQSIVSQLTAAGIIVHPLLIPDGGNPATSGTYNEKIKTAYSTYIDTWTTGFSTMSAGNGEMIDSVHPTNIGYIKLSNIIKAALPNVFNVIS